MIPDLDDGVLPEGVHDCTPEEVEAAFGRFQRTDRRMTLTQRLKVYLAEARKSGVVAAVVIDGSYTTAKDEPGDIDLIVVLKPDVDWGVLRPFEYNAVSKRMIKQLYRFDAFACAEGSPQYVELVDFFMKVDPERHAELTSRTRKGVLRVWL